MQQSVKESQHNWVGPADSVSNIRPIKFYIPDSGETLLEKQFREKQESTIEWNHNFWKKHNTKFFKVYFLFDIYVD